jgi:hypothetical protein
MHGSAPSQSWIANVSVTSAVCGVPNPNKMHALVMARFAREAMEKFSDVVSSLELKLGPDTVGTFG